MKRLQESHWTKQPPKTAKIERKKEDEYYIQIVSGKKTKAEKNFCGHPQWFITIGQACRTCDHKDNYYIRTIKRCRSAPHVATKPNRVCTIQFFVILSLCNYSSFLPWRNISFSSRKNHICQTIVIQWWRSSNTHPLSRRRRSNTGQIKGSVYK